MPARHALAVIEAMMRDAMEPDDVDELLYPPDPSDEQPDLDAIRAQIILAGGEVLA